MALLQSRRLITAIVLLIIFSPLFSFAQVKISEKVEVHPKAPTSVPLKSERNARTVAGSNRFFDPPLFVDDPCLGPVLTLTSTLTISGSITIGGDILGNQHAKLLVVSDQEHAIAWKGKSGWVGEPYSGESPYTGTFSAESYPDVRLYLFDNLWTDGVRTITFNENTLTYDFTGLLYQGTSDTVVPVTANATASGSILPQYRFDHWGLVAENMSVTGRDSTWIGIVPRDGTGGEPGEDGTPMEGGEYRPWSISPKGVEVTLRVDAAGDYVFLAFEEIQIDDETGEITSGEYHSGKEITMPLAVGGSDFEVPMTPYLVYDRSKGTFEGRSDTVYITITGEGKIKTIPVVIEKSEILLGETQYFYVARVDGEPRIKETKTTTLPGDFFPSFTWGDEPVTPAEQKEPNSGKPLGKKSGVYWETGKPIPNSTGDLPTGMIRLVGRYWHEDSVYKVQLTATHPRGRSVSLVIEVKKPDVLGDKKLSPAARHSIVKDVFNNDLNLDELIITYAGANGIPPQLIKGQMDQESTFKPQWRYEPMKDLEYQEDEVKSERFFPSASPFVISTDHPKGTGDWPYDAQPRHSNVLPTAYNDSAVTIGSYIAANLDKHRIIGKLGEPDSIMNSADLNQRFKELYKPPTKLNDKNDQQAKQSAYDALAKELKDAKTNLAQKYDLIAQTRIVTSYGFAQLMYSMTIDDDGKYYKETDGRYFPTGTPYMKKLDSHRYPEMLNQQDTLMPIYCDRMLRNLNWLFTGRIPPSQWFTMKEEVGEQKGYEANWKASLRYYNPDPRYANKVMLKSTEYLPH